VLLFYSLLIGVHGFGPGNALSDITRIVVLVVALLLRPL